MNNSGTTIELYNNSFLPQSSDKSTFVPIEDNTNNDLSIFDNSQQDVDALMENLEAAQNEQGFLGSLWDGFKNLTGLGLGSDDVEEKIEQCRNGEISLEEAQNSIDNYKNKQEGAVNIIVNTVTGLVTAGFAIATGGIGALVAAAFVGGATKAGLKTIDRATNDVQGDALDLKQIAKDGATGAVDGLVSAATAGMVSVPVAGQTVKETVKQGVIQGAKAGLVTGAATGAADYTVEAALEDDVEFKFDELLVCTAQNAATGAVFGGIFGGITGGISQKNLNNKMSNYSNESVVQAGDYIENYNRTHPNNQIAGIKKLTETAENLGEISQKSSELADTFKSQIDEAASQIDDAFSSNSDIAAITSRPKSQESIFNKLAKKSIANPDRFNDADSYYNAIGDALGIRIQLKSLDVDTTQEIVNNSLKQYGINASYDDFVRYISADETLSEQTSLELSKVSNSILDTLKEKQTQSAVNQLVDGIRSGKIKITELNNYGSEISSYFTNNQIAQIVDAYDYALAKGYIANDAPFSVTTRSNVYDSGNYDVTDDIIQMQSKYNDDLVISLKQNSNNALKDSGYTSSQMNTKHLLSDGTMANGELQIRGTKVNSFADVEHIPYDIRTGKISFSDSRYSDVYDIIYNMSQDNFNNYNHYLGDVYKTLRLQELGLLPDTIEMPKISSYITNGELSDGALSMLDMQGLYEISKRAH